MPASRSDCSSILTANRDVAGHVNGIAKVRGVAAGRSAIDRGGFGISFDLIFGGHVGTTAGRENQHHS